MRFRKSFLSWSLFAFSLVLTSPAFAQIKATSNKDVYRSGEDMVVWLKFTNATMTPVRWENQQHPDQRKMRLWYRIQKWDIDDPVIPTTFRVTLNGAEIAVRSIDFQNSDTSVLGGTIGPGSSTTFGFTLGFVMPLNLLQGYPSTYGATVTLTRADGTALPLQEGDRIRIEDTGVYELTVLMSYITINGYTYSPQTTGYLHDRKLITIR